METEESSNKVSVEVMWRRIEAASETLRTVTDDGFKINARRGVGKTAEFEEQADLLALGWRMAGNGQIVEGKTAENILSCLEGKPRLKFYVTYRALSEVYETESDEVMNLKPVTREWREALTEVVLEEVSKLDEMEEKERLGRLEVLAVLTTRWTANVDLISIERLLPENSDYTEKSVGESYLTLEEVERIGQLLLKKASLAETMFGTPEIKQAWKIIGRNFYSIWRRRKENEELMAGFFKKLQ